jgi:hypothetical protein
VGCSNTLPNALVAEEGDVGDFEDEVDIAREIEGWPGSGWVRVGPKGQDGDPDDVLQTCFPFPIYSPRLCKSLEEGGIAGIQYLPIRVIRRSGDALVGFCIANILNCVAALDMERSIIQRFPQDDFLPQRRGRVRAIKGPVLLRAALAPYDIIRLEGYTPPIYVSERFVRIFEAGGFTGYSFREITISDVVSV